MQYYGVTAIETMKFHDVLDQQKQTFTPWRKRGRTHHILLHGVHLAFHIWPLLLACIRIMFFRALGPLIGRGVVYAYLDDKV